MTRGSCPPEVDTVRHWLAALANEPKGGQLRIDGGDFHLEKFVDAAAAALSPRPQLRVEESGLHVTVQVDGLRRDQRPCAADGVMWVLNDGGPRVASAAEREALLDRAGLASCEGRRVPWATVETISPELADRLSAGSDIALSEHPGLRHDSGGVSVAGAVCLADRTLGGLPGIRLELHRQRRAEGVARECAPAVERNMGSPILATLDALSNELPLRLGVKPARRDVARSIFMEVGVNAVAHRSYRVDAWPRPIRVSVWRDSVEFSSPGLVAGDCKIVDGWFVGCWSRNPRVCALLTDLGLAHQQGRGATRLKTLAAHLGWDIAAEEAEDAILVRIDLISSAAELGTPAPRRNRSFSADDNALRVHHLLTQQGPQSARQVSAILGLAPSTGRAVLNRLVEELKVVERTVPGRSSPNQRYHAIAPLEL